MSEQVLKAIMRDVPRGVTTRYLQQQNVPKARWMQPEKIVESEALIYDAANPGSKILVGALGDKLIGIEDNRHLLTVAGSRSGKSVGLIGNLLFYRGSVLALDPKGELAAITAKRRKALGQKVFILDPFNTAPDDVANMRGSYNPLDILTAASPTLIEDAQLIADAMVVQQAGNKDPHWDECAKNFIEGIILHVVSDPSFAGAVNLISVRELIKQAMKPDERDDEYYALECAMLDNAARLERDPQQRDIGGAIEGAARDFYEKSERERDSVLSTVRRHTKFLDYSAFRNVLRESSFDLKELKTARKGLSVYLCFPATRIGVAGRWLRLFINQLLLAMEQERSKPACPVLVCLDEFPVLGYMKQLEDAAGQIASFHVKLWVILQDWGQGKALYGERWESFTANAGVMQFFGNCDVATTEYVSKLLGKTPVEVARAGEVAADQAAKGLSGRSSGIELYDLLRPEEITRQFARNDPLKRALIIWSGFNPMILQRVEYYDTASPLHGHFKGKYARA